MFDIKEKPFSVDTITRVEDFEGSWRVEFASSCFLYHIPKPEASLEPPHVGESIELFQDGEFAPIRGVRVGSRIYFYRTKEEEEVRSAKEQQVMQQEQKQTWETELPEFKRRVARLPQIFQERIYTFLRFSKEHGDGCWGQRYGSYELFCCEQAVLIADALKTPEAVDAWRKLNMAEQEAQIPGLAYADHSGNTFSAACMLAYVYLEKPVSVSKAHGALAPLVGSKEYGCYAHRKTVEGWQE